MAETYAPVINLPPRKPNSERKVWKIGDGLEDAILHCVVHKFLSERRMHVHPPAYGLAGW